jgi:hypothetical protein
MRKTRKLITAIWAVIFVLSVLAARSETTVNTTWERGYGVPIKNGDSDYGTEKRKPSPLPADAVVPAFSPFSISADSFCLIQKDDDNAAYFFADFQAGDGLALYMDPAQCGLPDPYPFKITDVRLYLYGFADAVWPVEIQVNIRDLSEGNKCNGPGNLLCFQTYTVPLDSAYPNLIHLDMDLGCCVYAPFFLEIIYTGQTNPPYPSFLMTDTLDQPDTCDAWARFFWEGQHWYFEWSLFWAPPAPGYPMMRAGGYTQASECDTCWYWKTDRPDQDCPAPSGMPDFDQNQDEWLAYSGPAAAANCLWWLDAVPDGMTPPELIELLADYFHTSPTEGTYVDSMQLGLEHYFQDFGFTLQESTFIQPDFFEMEDSLKVGQNIVLLLGFWWSDDGVEWHREGGHYVTMAGVCSEFLKLALSDPSLDGAVEGFPGRVRPPEHPASGQYDATLHNDPTYVSHDTYTGDLDPQNPSPGNPFWEIDYPHGPGKYSGINVPEKFSPFTRPAPKAAAFYATEVEYAVMLLSGYIRGDCNCDGTIDVGDVVFLVNYLFLGAFGPDPLDAGDADCNGEVDVGDIVYLVNYILLGGTPPGCY